MAAKTIWVQAQPTDANRRKVVLNEAHPDHPTENHEIWIVAYEDPRFDADGKRVEPANPPIEVANTQGVKQAIMDGDLVEVDAPAKAAKSSKPAKSEPPPPPQNPDPNAGGKQEPT